MEARGRRDPPLGADCERDETMKTNGAASDLRELMDRYDEYKARWAVVNGGSEEAYHKWFT